MLIEQLPGEDVKYMSHSLELVAPVDLRVTCRLPVPTPKYVTTLGLATA
jgi:hypothetical protein